MLRWLCLLLALCALSPANAAEKPPPPASGRLMASMAVGPSSYEISISYRNSESRKKRGLRGLPHNMFLKGPRVEITPPTTLNPSLAAEGYSYEPNPIVGHVVVNKIPAGRYEIYRIQMSSVGYYGPAVGAIASNDTIDGLSIPFEIRPGRTTYIGALEAFPLKAKSPLLQKMNTGFRVLVIDRLARDLQLARETETDLGEVDSQVPEVDGLHPHLGSTP